MSGSTWGDFLTEKTFRGGFNRLRNWKEDGEIVIWLHTNTRIYKRLFHMVPYAGIKKDENTGKERKSILYLPFVCHENVNDVIRNGKRHEPSRCPICRFIDYLKNNGDIDDVETVWDSSIGDRKRDRICTKADFVGDVEGGGDWRLTFKPAIQYVMAVIDHDNLSEGIRVATEKFSLGEKIKKAVLKEIDRRGQELGDPDLNPYAFKWVFDSSARQAADYYDAYPFERAEITPEIEDLLSQEALDLNPWISPGDTSILREAMEAHVTVDDVDFDMLFDSVLPNQGTEQPDEPEEAAVEEDESKPEPKPKKAKKAKAEEAPKKNTKKASKDKKEAAPKKRKIAPKPEPEPEPEPEDSEEDDEEVAEEETTVEMMTCPSCKGKGKKKNGKDCKVCDGTGEVEAPDDDDDEEEEEPPPPPPKKEKPKNTKPKQKTRTVAKPAPEPEPEDEEEEVEEVAECGRCGKDVPTSATSCPHCGATFQ